MVNGEDATVPFVLAVVDRNGLLAIGKRPRIGSLKDYPTRSDIGPVMIHAPLILYLSVPKVDLVNSSDPAIFFDGDRVIVIHVIRSL